MIIFKKTGLSDLYIPVGRTFPSNEPIQTNQNLYLTSGSQAKVVVTQAVHKTLELRLDGLPRDSFDGVFNGIKTWFESAIINWSYASFTMTDENGADHTVRLWQKKFNMPRVNNGLYSTKLLLKVS